MWQIMICLVVGAGIIAIMVLVYLNYDKMRAVLSRGKTQGAAYQCVAPHEALYGEAMPRKIIIADIERLWAKLVF